MLAGKTRDWVKECWGSLRSTVNSPEAWSVTMMSGSPSPFTSATAMSDGATPAGTVIGAAKCPGEICRAMVTLLSRALATIRSSSPFPVRSAAARLVGRAVVEKASEREKTTSLAV